MATLSHGQTTRVKARSPIRAARGGSRLINVAGFTRWLVSLYLASLVLSGPVRYVADLVHAPLLVYIPKAFLFVAIPVLLIARQRVSLPALVSFSVVAAAFGIGLAVVGDVRQVAYGLWVLTPFLFGILAAPYIFGTLTSYRGVVSFLLAVALIGVLANVILQYPWSGAQAHVAGFDISVSRHWYAGSFARLAGFSRSSSNAAPQLAILSIWLISGLRSRRLAAVVWILTAIAIVLTTSKGGVFGYVVVGGYLLVGRLVRGRQAGLSRRLWAVTFVMILALGSALPLMSYVTPFRGVVSHGWLHFLFASFGERLNWTWPQSLGLLTPGWTWLTGRGLGGIGSPQQLFSPGTYLPGDNFFVYLTVDVGVLASAVLFIGLGAWVVTSYSKGAMPAMAFALALFVALYGVVLSVPEFPMAMFALAMAVGGARPRMPCKHSSSDDN